jgi:hypothetical protein
MRTKKLMLLIAVAMLALAHRSDGQQARPVAEQLKLAAVMPRGAMVYVQASDLAALMKTWLASPVRSKFYDSASFAAFQKSHVYLKLQDRKKDFETAIGVGLDEKRLAELAGRASAVSVYDIGKLEIVFVTEVPRARAVASALFKLAPQFSERSADGTSYYVRDVATDGGRLNQQFCFAYVEGMLIVTTTEGLMIRAVSNAKAPSADSLSSDVVALAEQAGGFSAHDVTMWLDQTRLNRNRYFDNYWIHQNVSGELANIESGLIDLRITREGMNEQRWFKMGVASQGLRVSAISAEQIAAFMKFAPANAQLVQVRAAAPPEHLSSAIEESLFGELPEDSWSPPEIPDRTRATGSEDEHTRAERYSRLDSRFDIDVDDEQAPKRGSGDGGQVLGKTGSNAPAASDFAKSVGPILANVSTTSYCELVRSRSEAGKPFVRFERAIVAQLKPDAAVNREALEAAILSELRARFVVAGTQPRLEWQDEGAVRFVAQSLLEQGAAYSVSGNYLVLASSKELASDILQAAKASTSSSEKTDGPVEFYALIRVAAAKPAFDTLMSTLDGRDQPTKPSRGKKDEEEEREVKFFSENLSSLVAASTIREVHLTRQSAGPITTERVVYSW